MRFLTDNRIVDQTTHVPIQVVGAGLPRAATSSLSAAFEILGFTPTLHNAHVLPHPARERLLLGALRELRPEGSTEKRQKLLGTLLAGHVGVTDVPGCMFVADLMDMYPDAKIILNGRPDPELWARSAYESFWFFFNWRFQVVSLLWTTDRLWYAMNMECVGWIHRELGEVQGNNIFTADVYNKYYQRVREEAAKRNREILEFKAEDGWEPLCRFLGKPVPDQPFPRLNERNIFGTVRRVIIAKGLASWVVLGSSIWAAYRFGQWFWK